MGTLTDGNTPIGTPLVVIDGTTYELDNINIDRGEDIVTGLDRIGKPNRERITEAVPTLTADLQMATENTPFPAFGQTFTLNVDPNYGNETWKVLPQNYTADNTGLRTIPLRARKVINPGEVTFEE